MTTNPYVGPHPFKKGQRIYGRDQEVEELLDLLMAERIVLLYSPSGAGKTSLLQAGLLPRMEKEGFRPLPVLRVSRLPAGDEVSRVAAANRYILSLLLYLEDGLPAGVARIAPSELATMKLTDYLKRQYDLELDTTHQVLIFDQFEEILTLRPAVLPPAAGGDPDDPDGQQRLLDADEETKRAFFQQVGAALRDRRRWAIFAMREDYVAPLHPYLATVPTRFGNTYRLDLLDSKGALAAVTLPAHEQKVEFTAEAAEGLVNNLRLTRLTSPAGPVKVFGPYVEPVQLQVVCWSLWNKLGPEAGQVIGADVVEKLGDSDDALMGYYDEQVGAVSASLAGEREREIRDWFDRQLITVQGMRGRVLQGDPSQTVSDRVVGALVDAHLIREDKRGGVTWFELAHDRLIDPVRKSNDAWAKAHLQPLQRMAVIWDNAGRPADNYLLRHKELEEAEGWAASHAPELNRRDAAFLEACYSHRERGEQKRIKERAARYRNLGLAALVIIVCLASLAAWALWERGVAEQHAATIGIKNNELTIQGRKLEAEKNRNQRKVDVFTCNNWSQAALDRVDADAEFTVRLGMKAMQVLDKVKGQREDAVKASSNTQDADSLEEADAIEEARKSAIGVLNRGVQNSRVTLTLKAPKEYDSNVNAVSFSPDGKQIASATDDGAAIVWDARSGAPLHKLRHMTKGNVNSLAFSPDGKLLATAGDDGCVKVWDWAAEKLDGEPLLGCGELSSVAFSPNPKEKKVAAGSSDFTVRIWDLSKADPGATAHDLAEHTDKIGAVAFSPDGKRLASASKDGTVKIWNAEGQYELRYTLGEETALHTDLPLVPVGPNQDLPIAHHSAFTALAFSPDGKYLAAASDNMSAQVWDVETGKSRQIRLPYNNLQPYQVWHSGAIHAVAFSPDGSHLATAGRDKLVKVWDANTGGLELTLGGHRDIVTGLAFDPQNSDRLASSSDDHTVKVWDRRPRREWCDLTSAGLISKIALSADGALAAGASSDGKKAVLWDLCSMKPAVVVANASGHTQPIRAVAFSPDGKSLLTGSQDRSAIIWDVGSGRQVQILSGHNNEIWDVAYNPRDGRKVATGSLDGTVRLWDANSGEQTTKLMAPALIKFYGIAFSHDGSRLAAGGISGLKTSGQRLALWDLSTGGELPPLLGPTNTITSVAFSPDDKRLASAGWDMKPRIWDVASTPVKELNQLVPGPVEDFILPSNNLLTVATAVRQGVGSSWLSRITFSPDGNQIATCGYDGKVRLYDGASGAERRVFMGHRGIVWGAAFSPDGTRLATAGADGSVRLWETTSGKEQFHWNAHMGGVFAVTFDRDGARVATGGQDCAARVWDAADGKLLQNFNGQTYFTAVTPHPDGKSFAALYADNSVAVCDRASGRPARFLPELALGSTLRNRFQEFWFPLPSLAAPAASFPLFSHQDPITNVAYSSEGGRLATADSDGIVKIWDPEKGYLVQTLGVRNSPVLCLAFSPRGRRLVTGSSDRKARVWDPETGRLLQTLAGPEAHVGVAESGHATSVLSVAFSPDGDMVATGGLDSAVKLWKVTGQEDEKLPPIKTLFGHNGSVEALAFSPDGKRLATASSDTTLKVWDVSSGAELFSFATDDAQVGNMAVTEIAFTSDDRVVTIDGQRILRTFLLNTEELNRLANERISQHDDLTPEEIKKALHSVVTEPILGRE